MKRERKRRSRKRREKRGRKRREKKEAGRKGEKQYYESISGLNYTEEVSGFFS